MRLVSSRIVPLAAFAVVVFASGCSEINATVDKAQACLEAPKIVSETVAKISGLVNDPAAMEKELDAASKKLGEVADKASNTTLKEATDDLAASLGKLDVNSANEAVDAVQQVGNDTAAYLTKLKEACS
ncbi:hypothetical protein AB0B45_33735 [Nonomuraea sp. NPDC049152]|uniref:hypothetical protein n=1 Tax=Nonomuraea sp. NPDC049152 TaxID=3154350 RepID=UPI0034037906